MASLNIDSWSPSDVAQWIKGLGPQFESCSESFVDEEINGKALLAINTEYLAELSIENVTDQNAILDAVHCLIEVDSCLQEETVHGQVIVVNEQTKKLIDKLEKESEDASEGDITTSESSTKIAGQVYQLAKKLLSWLLRSPFSEMNACWPLKDSVCRVVRDMTDESLLKNRAHLQENLRKLQISFDNFLNEEPLHEVFKQSPILVDEEFTLEEEGLGIGITTSHHIHTVNSVAPESPAGKNGNIKNGDEIVNVNGQCVIAWPQKNVVSLMKSKPDLVSLTLKKLPPVVGPLNKPLDKPGTPLSEMNVVMDRTKVAPERPARVEMKEAGIKEETSLEMQAIENENSEENSQVEAKIEGIEEEDEGKAKENQKKTNEVENDPKKGSVDEEAKQGNAEETPAREGETEAKPEPPKEESEKEEASAKVVENGQPATDDKVDEKKSEEAVENRGKVEEKNDAAVVSAENAAGGTESKVQVEGKAEKVSNGESDEAKVQVNGDVKEELKEQEKQEGGSDNKSEKVVNGEATTPEKLQSIEAKNTEDISQSKSKANENDASIKINVESPSPTKQPASPSVTENAQNGTSLVKEPPSPTKKPGRPELPKMKMGSVKNVTVGGASAKQVEVYGTSNVVRRQKKIDGAPNKRISCIELGEADCEGWLTKKSGGHGITPTRWRRQWCVLKEEHLYYYKTSFDREAGGVIDISGYTVSAAPEVKKPFAFKCEKSGGKKYIFHADNEVDRDMWVKSLNLASRGERKQKETGAGMMSVPAEHRASASALKVGQSNRPRTGSVLAGIRFNYYDDDDMEDKRKISSEPSAADRVNDALHNGQHDIAKPSSSDDAAASQNVLKIADGVEDACQVVPVGEIAGDKETDAKDKVSPEVAKSELQEKDSEESPKEESTTNEANVENKEESEAKAVDKTGEVSTSEDTKEVVGEDSTGEVSTQEVNEVAKETAGTGETSVEDKDIKVSGETETDEGAAKESEDIANTSKDDTVKSEDETAKPESDTNESKDDTTESKDDTTESRDDTTESKDDTTESKDDTTESKDGTTESKDDTTESKDGTTESKDDTTESKDGTTESKDDTTESKDDTTESKDGTTESKDDTTESKDDTTESKDDTTESKEDTTESKDGTTESKDDTTESKDDTTESKDDTTESKDDTTEFKDEKLKPEDVQAKSEGDTVEPEDSTEKLEADAPKSEDGTLKTEDSATKSDDGAEKSEEQPTDEFQKVAESIQEADIGLDGSEKSPAALLRRLSLNSQNEIMDKVVKLRVLKQNLKDKEESMSTIDELLSSDVTPESIAEWRAKYETVANSESNDPNQNS